MDDLLNEIRLLMSILTHICLSARCVHSRASVSIVTYANQVLLSQMHESQPIIVMNYRTLSLKCGCLISSVKVQLALSGENGRRKKMKDENATCRPLNPYHYILSLYVLYLVKTCSQIVNGNTFLTTYFDQSSLYIALYHTMTHTMTHRLLWREGRQWWCCCATYCDMTPQMCCSVECHHEDPWKGSLTMWVASHRTP